MERTLDIGRLDKKVKFNKLVTDVDGMGQLVQRMRTIYTLHATLYPVRGSEFYSLKKIQSEVSHKCYVRYRSDIDDSFFIEFDGVLYAIKSVIDVDLKHKFLEIMCSEYHGKEVKSYEQNAIS